MADEKTNAPGPRTAYFGCKNCGAVNEQPFPEVRVIAKIEPCKCGVSSESRIARAWATTIAIAGSILILSGFGSCVADHYFTTEQIKSLPAEYKVDHTKVGDGLGPEFKVNELNPQEKERRAMQDRIKALEKELEGKGK